MEIPGPVTSGRQGWSFGASIEDLAPLGYDVEGAVAVLVPSD